MAAALLAAGKNKEADVIRLFSDIHVTARLIYNAEDYPLMINGNGYTIFGDQKIRCLDIQDRKKPLQNAHIRIRDLNVVRGSDLAAGGLLINYRSPGNSSNVAVIHCTFSENQAKLWEHGWGGGAYINTYDGNVVIDGCRFSKNASAGGAGGAKIEASGSGNVSISSCRFIENTAAVWYGGVLVHTVNGGKLEFLRNIVANNVSYRRPAGGAGIWVGFHTMAKGLGSVADNLIHGNTSGEVSGIYVWARGENRIDLENNTIAFNSGNIGMYLRAETSSDVISVYNTIVWGHPYDIIRYMGGNGMITGGYNCYQTGRSDLTSANDVTRFPGFIGNEDFHLKEGSPCIDAGIDDYGVPATDLDGIRRPQGRGIDLGAFEFVSVLRHDD